VRLERCGPNEIVEQHKNPLLVMLRYFWAPIPWMIEVALILSLVVTVGQQSGGPLRQPVHPADVTGADLAEVAAGLLALPTT
jgi:hypothetical protein